MTTIVTNNHWIDVVEFSELPEDQKREFADNQSAITDGGNYDSSPEYFRFKGDWFALSQFTRISTKPVGFEHGTSNPEVAKWHGIMHGTYDSGWLIRYCDNGDHAYQVQVARFY